jgi:hypothetical protein
MLLPLEFNDWVKQFPISQENKKRAEDALKWLKKNNKPFTAQPMKIRILYNLDTLQEIKKILQDNEIDIDRTTRNIVDIPENHAEV